MGTQMSTETTLEKSTRFSGLLDLARLPYFTVREGRIALADRALGPAIDMHTHLALEYGFRARTNLYADDAPAEHYLGAERPLDLDLYANRNFTPDDLRRLRIDLTVYSLTARGMRRTHTIPNLAREMDELGVVRSVLLPIDFPVLSQNARTWLEATRGRRELVCFGSVHPMARDLARKLDEQVRLGARGIKVHPAVQMIGPDHERARRLYRLAGERRLPVLFHCGPVGIEPAAGRRRSQVRRYEQGIAECPETTFVLGHSGALQHEQALELARRYPNVWLELSSQGIGVVRQILDEASPERIVFGSDWPFYHQAFGLAKVFLATEGRDALRRAVLHDNAARLLGIEAA